MDTEEEKSLHLPNRAWAETLLGDRWSMLVLRDIDRGMTRFDQLRAGLGIAPNILASRLAALTQPACSRSASIANGRRASNIY